MFTDASVIVAIIGEEDDASHLMDRLTEAEGPFYVSSLVRMEATLALTRQFARALGRDKPATQEIVAKARHIVDQFVLDLDAREVAICGDVGTKALVVAQQYGKIVNHPAKLNMGDCFTYACARAYRTKIAYKGDDFIETDLGW